jgi:hypothetical protein
MKRKCKKKGIMPEEKIAEEKYCQNNCHIACFYII